MPEKITPGTLYKVKSTDNLWTIAENAYGPGKGSQYTWIVNANKNNADDGNRITDPGSIRAGQVFISAGQVFYIPITGNLTEQTVNVPKDKALRIRTEPNNASDKTIVETLQGGSKVVFTEVTDKGQKADGGSSNWGRTPKGRFFWMDNTDWKQNQKENQMVAPITPGTLYTVVSGDKLWTIAERAYGKGLGSQYTWIANANKNNADSANQITDPGTIFGGQVFYIPITGNLTEQSVNVPTGKKLRIRAEPNTTSDKNIIETLQGGSTVVFTEVTDQGEKVSGGSSNWGRTPKGRFFWMDNTDWNDVKG